jgi:hypothetical protein
MGKRLIDANAYAAELWKLRGNYQMLDDTHTADKIMHGIFRAEQALKEQPTVDAVPVRHAFWYWDKDGMDRNIGAWRCSACHNRPNTMWETGKNPRPRMWSGSAYCSNCGAVMDGKEQTDVDR